jgi:hypothetical protein
MEMSTVTEQGIMEVKQEVSLRMSWLVYRCLNLCTLTSLLIPLLCEQ